MATYPNDRNDHRRGRVVVARATTRLLTGRGRAGRTHLLPGTAELGVVRGPGVKHAVVGTRIVERGLAADAHTGGQAPVALHLELEAIGLTAVLCGIPASKAKQSTRVTSG